MSGVGVIILAAGGSSRMGAPKQLLQMEGKTFIRRAAEIALGSVCEPVIAVLGAHAATIRGELQGLPILTVDNTEWEQGMGSSIVAGMEALLTGSEPDLQAVVVMLCDQPRVRTETLDNLIRTSRDNPDRIIASEYGGDCGVPALFPRSLFPELLRLNGTTGAKSLLRQYHDRVVPISFPDGLLDIDTPDDYRQALQNELNQASD